MSLPHPPDRRKPISRRLRFEILRRDNNTCRYCHATDTPLTIDHVTPVTLGGTDDPSNLVAACKDCNAGKTSTSPDAALVAQVSDDAMRWAGAMKLAADRMGIRDEAKDSRLTVLGDYWYEGIPRYNHDKPKWRLPSDWKRLIAGVLEAGLPDAVVFDCMDIAVNQRGNVDNAFRYMLGVARNKLVKLQDEAKAILAEADPAEAVTERFHAEWVKGFDDAFRVSLVHESWMQARALSRVVDGSYRWNTAPEKVVS